MVSHMAFHHEIWSLDLSYIPAVMDKLQYLDPYNHVTDHLQSHSSTQMTLTNDLEALWNWCLFNGSEFMEGQEIQ